MLKSSHERLGSPVLSAHTLQGPWGQSGVSVSCGCDLSRSCTAVPTLEPAGGSPAVCTRGGGGGCVAWATACRAGPDALRYPGPGLPFGHKGHQPGVCLRYSPCRLFVSGLPAPPGPVTAGPSRQDRKWVSGLSPPGAEATTAPPSLPHPLLLGESPNSHCMERGAAGT